MLRDVPSLRKKKVMVALFDEIPERRGIGYFIHGLNSLRLILESFKQS